MQNRVNKVLEINIQTSDTRPPILLYFLIQVPLPEAMLLGDTPGGSHIDLVYICACLLECFLVELGTAIGEFSSETKEPKFKNWVYFEQIIVKSTQFGQNWVFFYCKKGILMGE